MGMSFTIDSAALEAKLKSLTGQKQEQIMRAALRAGATVYRTAVQAAAPERTDGLTSDNSTALPPGALKSDVIVQKKANQLEYDVKFGSETAHVAKWVNDGHRIVVGGSARFESADRNARKKSGSGHSVGFVEGSDFFPQAFETATAEAAAAVEKTLVEQIQKAWKE